MRTPNKKAIPQNPGVYFFRRGRDVLYVGKATNIRARLGSYFAKGADLGPAKTRLLHEATGVTWEETGSEIEALLLEAHYIKKYHPRYNILLRDDKTFVSVKITDETFPRVITTRKIEPGGTYYGPFTDARAIKETLRVLRRFFPYRTNCVPFVASVKKGVHQQGRACLDAHLGLCPGVCVGRVSAREYQRNIRRIKLFFAGKRPRIIASLKQELKTLKKQPSDDAALRRERIAQQIQWLQKVVAMSHVLRYGEKAESDVDALGKALNLGVPPHRIEGYDISNILGLLATGAMVVFTDGNANKHEYRKFKIKTVRGANDVAMLKEVLRRRFSHSLSSKIQHTTVNNTAPWPLPDLVVVDGGRPQLNAALEIWRDFSLTIPLVSLAKRYEEVYVPGSPHPLVLPRTSGALHLLQRVRDEAHRFCLSYHKLLRRKKLVRR